MEKVTPTVMDNSLQTNLEYLDFSLLNVIWNRSLAYIQASVSPLLPQEGCPGSPPKSFMPSKSCAPQAARQPEFLQG